MRIRSDVGGVATRRRGFTLIELLVVVTIIGILAGVVVVSFAGQDDKAKVTRVQADFKGLKTAMSMFRQAQGRWPESLQELMNPPEDPMTGAIEPYLESTPTDPWTNEEYIFQLDERGKPVFVSYGADRQEGGEGVNADIYSSEQR